MPRGASATPLNDGTESRALMAVLGEHATAIPVSGTKPYYGHALGAFRLEHQVGFLGAFTVLEWSAHS